MNKFEDNHFGSIVDEIFSMKDRKKSLDLIDQHSKFWMQMQSGSQGFSGKKTVNNMTSLQKNFEGEVDHQKKLEKEKRKGSTPIVKNVSDELAHQKKEEKTKEKRKGLKPPVLSPNLFSE
jgi:hypothetical protein